MRKEGMTGTYRLVGMLTPAMSSSSRTMVAVFFFFFSASLVGLAGVLRFLVLSGSCQSGAKSSSVNLANCNQSGKQSASGK